MEKQFDMKGDTAIHRTIQSNPKARIAPFTRRFSEVSKFIGDPPLEGRGWEAQMLVNTNVFPLPLGRHSIKRPFQFQRRSKPIPSVPKGVLWAS